MTGNEITAAFEIHLERYLQDIIFSNFFCGPFEMDIFRLTNKRMIWEYEVKVTRADFFNDFKKHSGYRNSGDNKHELLEAGGCFCNRFTFIVPTDLVKLEEIPHYAGLIYYDGRRFTTIKRAPLLKKDKDGDDRDFMFTLLKKAALRDNLRKRAVKNLKAKIKRGL